MSEYTENVAEKFWLELMGEYTTQNKIVDISRKRNVVVAENVETDGYEQEEAAAVTEGERKARGPHQWQVEERKARGPTSGR